MACMKTANFFSHYQSWVDGSGPSLGKTQSNNQYIISSFYIQHKLLHFEMTAQKKTAVRYRSNIGIPSKSWTLWSRDGSVKCLSECSNFSLGPNMWYTSGGGHSANLDIRCVFFSLLLFPAGFWHAFSLAIKSWCWSVWDWIFQISIHDLSLPSYHALAFTHLHNSSAQ